MTAPPSAEWWTHAPALFARLASRPLATGPVWYRFGDGYLALASEDRALAERCQNLFEECATALPPPAAATLTHAEVRQDLDTGCRLITLRESAPVHAVDLILRHYSDRGYQEGAGTPAGWRVVAHPDAPPDAWIIGKGSAILTPDNAEWRPLIGSLLVSRVLAQQPDVLFLHAGALAVRGAGLVIAGPRGAGKTTTALALASRGHPLLSDELAAIRLPTRALLPVRRATSIRAGPRGAGVEAALAGEAVRQERYPDGALRLRATPSALFPARAPEAVPLRWLLLLRDRGALPAIEWVEPALEFVRRLHPVGYPPGDPGTAARGMRLFGLLRQVRCGYLDLGEPDATAAYLERLEAD